MALFFFGSSIANLLSFLNSSTFPSTHQKKKGLYHVRKPLQNQQKNQKIHRDVRWIYRSRILRRSKYIFSWIPPSIHPRQIHATEGYDKIFKRMVGGITVLIQEYRDIGGKVVGRDRERWWGFKDEGDDFWGERVFEELYGNYRRCYIFQKIYECELQENLSPLLPFHFPFSQKNFFWAPPFDQNIIVRERDGEPKDPGATKQIIENKIKKFEAERAQIAPKWWSEWLALNRPESENTESGDENAAADSDGTRPPPKDSDNSGLKVDWSTYVF